MTLLTTLKTRYLLIMTLVSSPILVLAHPDASAPDFCPDGQVVNAAQLNIPGNFLAIITSNKHVNCPVGIQTTEFPRLDTYVGKAIAYNNPLFAPPYSHGRFDGQARVAYSFASCMCAAILNSKINLAKMRPLLTGPPSLVSEDHDNTYELVEGLSFTCSICQHPTE